MASPSSSGDNTLVAHAAIYFVLGAALGGGADVLATVYWGEDMARIAGFGGFLIGLILARAITLRWLPDDRAPRS